MRRRRRMSFAKRVMSVSPKQTMVFVTAARADGDYGKQMFTNGNDNFQCMNKAELTNILALVPGADDNTEVLVKNKKSIYHFSNMESTNVLVTIYHYKFRRDENDGPGVLISKGIADAYGSTTYDNNTYGMTPFRSQLFTKTCKIQKIIALELGAGRSHIHTAKWNINKILNKSVITETDSDTTNLGGWTQGIFIIARGEPVNDAVTTPGHTSVTPSPTALDFVVTEKVEFVYGDPNKKQLAMTYSLPVSGLTLRQMNEETGAVANVAEA